VEDELDPANVLLEDFYSAEIKKMDELRIECCFILYGAAYVGKTFLVNNLKGSTEIIDCTQMGTLVSSLDSIDTLLEYLQLKLARVMDDPSPSKLIVFDNIHAIAPKEDSSIGMVNIIKSERVTQWLCMLIDDNPDVKICLVTRHFSLINQKLLEIGYFDTLV
jgi:hypothetical protein